MCSAGQNTSVLPFNMRALLPPLLAQFFRYNGSLTTPPCYQSVLWTVFNRRAQISMGQVSGGERRRKHNCTNTFPLLSDTSPLIPLLYPQLEKLQETLLSTEKEPSTLLVQNYRLPQALNQRTVLASFIQGD